MLVRHDLTLIKGSWLLPVTTFSLKCLEMFPKDLLPDISSGQSQKDRAVVLWIVILDFLEGRHICLSPIVRDLTPPPWPCKDTLGTLHDTYMIPWTLSGSYLTVNP